MQIRFPGQPDRTSQTLSQTKDLTEEGCLDIQMKARPGTPSRGGGERAGDRGTVVLRLGAARATSAVATSAGARDLKLYRPSCLAWPRGSKVRRSNSGAASAILRTVSVPAQRRPTSVDVGRRRSDSRRRACTHVAAGSCGTYSWHLCLTSFEPCAPIAVLNSERPATPDFWPPLREHSIHHMLLPSRIESAVPNA